MSTILRYLTENKLLITLFILMTFVAGIVTYKGLKKDFMPSIDFDAMTIKVVYPGASATDVELNVIVSIEDKLAGISNIKEYTSISTDDGGTIFVNIDPDASNVQRVKDEIYRNISKETIEDLPSGVKEIILTEIDPDVFAVYEISVSAKEAANVSDKELFDLADRLEDMLKKVNGVNNVSMSGYLDREIHINIDPEKMSSYYISLNDVVNSIQVRNVRSTGGTLQSLQNEQNIVSIGEFSNPMDVKDVIVRSNFEQKRVHIKDIANVKDSFKDADVYIRANKEKSVILSISKKANADIIKTIDNIKDFFDKNKAMFSDKFELTVIRDMSDSIRSLLDVVINNAAIGFVLVVVILFIFLDLKTSLWTAFGIPISLMMLFVYMYKTDMTFNTMTLGAIITVLGMLVDHGIVAAEAIHHNKSMEMSSMDAVVAGVKSIFSPVIVSVLTTIMAFLPLLAIKGIIGKLIYVFPVVVTATLLFSLFEAMFILPVHLKDERPKEAKKSDWFISLENIFEKYLKKILKYRYLVVVLLLVSIAPALFLCKGVISNFVLLSDDSSDKITINLEADKGTSLKYMREISGQVENLVFSTIPEKQRVSVLTKVGLHASGMSQEYHTNWAQITINLIPKTQRTKNAAEIIASLRKEISPETIKDLKLASFEKSGLGPSAGDPVNIKLISNNSDTLQTYREKIKNFLASIKGVQDIDDDQKLGKEELRLVFDYNKLAQYELSVADIARTIRTAYEGTIASHIQTLDRKIDFRVKIDDAYQRDSKFLYDLLIPNKSGRLIKLKEIVSFKVKDGKSKVNHYNGDRVLTITAKIDEKIATSNQINQLINVKFRNEIEQCPDLTMYFGGEAEKTDEAMEGIAAAFLIAILSIYLIIVALFRSFSQPLIIITIIPFGLLGALIAFALHRVPLSLFGIIGMIGLTGVVVNDSIIIVDFINKLARDPNTNAQNVIQLIALGVKERLRAVLLTTLTTLAGLFPTIYGFGGDVGILVPIVMAMGYGLLFATGLTLFITPSLYMIDGDIKMLFKRIINKIFPSKTTLAKPTFFT